MNVQLVLTKEFFDLTKRGNKTEDYRLITPYWCSRLLTQNGKKESQKFWEQYLDLFGKDVLAEVCTNYDNVHRIKAKIFHTNILTLGYPKKSDRSRYLIYHHGGIEIREGRPEWGAKEGELYLVIKHGARK